MTLSFGNLQFPDAVTDGAPMTFQSEFQPVKTDQYARLCATVSKVCEPFIEWDAPIPVF